MAWSMPCTGKGVKTSHLRNPASRTFSAACMTEAAVVYSAIMPYGRIADTSGMWNSFLRDESCRLRVAGCKLGEGCELHSWHMDEGRCCGWSPTQPRSGDRRWIYAWIYRAHFSLLRPG